MSAQREGRTKAEGTNGNEGKRNAGRRGGGGDRGTYIGREKLN